MNAPTNARCTTPSTSAITVVGIAASVVAAVEIAARLGVDLARRDVERLERHELLAEALARVARGRREQRDQPRRIGPREVGAVELLGHRVHVARWRVGRAAAQEPGDPADRDQDHRRDHEPGRHRRVTRRTWDRGSPG